MSRRYITASVVSFGPAFVYQFYPCAVMMSCATLDPCIGACSSSRKRRNRVRRVAVRWSQAHSLALARLFLVRAERECDVLDVPVISQPDQFRPSLPCTTLCLCSLIPEVSAVGFSVRVLGDCREEAKRPCASIELCENIVFRRLLSLKRSLGPSANPPWTFVCSMIPMLLLRLTLP